MAALRCSFALLTAALLGGCVAGEQVRNLRGGETRTDVERVMGNPDGYRREGNVEALTYSNRLMSGWGWDRADYHVVITDGLVSAYGPSTIRQQTSPVSTLLLIPLR